MPRVQKSEFQILIDAAAFDIEGFYREANRQDYQIMLNAQVHKGQRLFDGYCRYDVWIRGLPLGHKFS